MTFEKGLTASTWDVIDKIGTLGGVILCAGANAAWLVVAIPDSADTHMALFKQHEDGWSDILVCAATTTVGLSMVDTPIRVLRSSVRDAFGKKIDFIEGLL